MRLYLVQPEDPRRVRRRRLGAVLAPVALLGVIWLAAAAMLAPKAPVPLPVSAIPAAHGRITYPAGHLPVLDLPGGERRQVRSLLDIGKPMEFGEFVWNDAGVPAGPVWIRVDLGLQVLSVFRAGHEIGSTVILYGAEGKPTPPGVYPILERARHHRSTLYDAPMPFMLRLTPDGVAIHASNVRAAAATHGCIGVPPEFARRLFEQARRGDKVAIIGAERS
ncbi:L,D-transpeptidase family protein [Novosphingobium sp. 9U]|uniref:L,D-transpeptidase family protein n=1 Tax=Novosphingobium sp. 9U TaxID=2653158 RepID=UPI0012F363D2|nr:L,D-transpeptidase family protein [Novosphingobium sp. 9U]VWX52937.1 hypothetical protein NOVOSPHI9U_420180 [Novosphingobium sp. 9U]